MSDSAITDITSAIQVRHILTPISEVRRFNRVDRVETVRSHLDANKFDFSPVFSSGASPSAKDTQGRHSADGFVRRIDLTNCEADKPIERLVCPLTSDVLIAAKASLNELLDRFRAKQSFLIVVGSAGLDGIVTPSDLNKQAGRTQLFMQVSALELGLADIVRAMACTDDQLLGLLPKTRAKVAGHRYKRQIEQDEAADLVTALDLQDLLYACIAKSPADSALSRVTRGQIQHLSRFRNKIMHAVLEPAGDDDVQLKELLDQTKLVTQLRAGTNTAEANPR